MGDVYRETRVYRGDSDDDDDRYKTTTTVRRYKVHPDRYERTERIEVDDDYRSRYSGRTSGDLLELERRSAAPDRPRSAFEPYGDRHRPGYYDRDLDRDPRDDRSRISVYEQKDDRDWDRRSHHHHHHHHHDDDIKVEKRVEERYEDPHGHEYERYRKETEYYTQVDPPPAPVIVRQRAPEPQKIIVQEAPPPAPIIVPRQEPGVVVIREKEPERELVRREPIDEEYYYRHERREVGPYDRDRDRDFGIVGRHRHHRDGHEDDDYYVRRTVVRRERSESPHHKRHLAEGALAAAGLTAYLSSRRDKDGDLAEHRGRKVIAGAALGALGTEALKRAHSAYTDRYGEEDRDRHDLLKKGLGVAAVALAAAGAAKYIQANKVEKEEASRGRSRRRNGRHSDSEYSRSRSRSVRSKSRRRSLSNVAKAALGTAAAAGIVKKFRDRSKSKSRSRSRSKSRIRRGAEIAGAAAAAGVASKMWKNHRDKKDDREYSSDEESRSRRRKSSHSRSRSRARSLHSEHGSGTELGLVEYGNSPLPSEAPGASERNYESEAEERRRRRRRRRERERSASLSEDDKKRSHSRLRNMAAAGAAAMGIKEMKDRHDRKEESRDRASRDAESRDRRASRDRDRERRRYDRDVNNIDERDAYYNDRPPRSHSPPTASGGAYYPPYPEGPAMSGFNTSYHDQPNPPYHDQPNPPYNNQANPAAGTYSTYVPQDYMGYPPAAPPGPPPGPGPGPSGYPPAPPGQPPTGGIPPNHVSDISRSHRGRDGGDEDGVKRDRSVAPSREPSAVADSTPKPAAVPSRRDSPPTREPSDERLSASVPPDSGATADRIRIPVSKSVSFIPLSPKSSMTMERHQREKEKHEAGQSKSKPHKEDEDVDDSKTVASRPEFRRRRSSDPSSDRPVIRRGGARAHETGVSDVEEEVENLPDRFDATGKPLDGRASSHKGWTSRSGEFVRKPQHAGDWDAKGSWQVGGTEAEVVERLAKTMTGVIEGRNSWMQLLGGVGGLLLPEAESSSRGHGRVDDDEDDRNAKHRRRK
ncbi:hypothetical protein B0I35DRAFT_474495 [Stachybotrys elegans]|uniref:DUF3824 domain-containing protein n=1 Tax=Stachybotrys elegans TaxID=80388 RepID=A0A8K0WUM2_9HYPO|nr:hypothetical protein B0I35DRAFT_474495 [Stachybotrys elegans]